MAYRGKLTRRTSKRDSCRRCKRGHQAHGFWLFRRSAQYFFILSECALRCAAVRFRRSRTVVGASAALGVTRLFGGLPRRLVGPWSASIAVLIRFRSKISSARICSIVIRLIVTPLVLRRYRFVQNCGMSLTLGVVHLMRALARHTETAPSPSITTRKEHGSGTVPSISNAWSG